MKKVILRSTYLYILISIILFSPVDKVLATPDPSRSIEESFLGCNKNHYYTYIVEFSQPGSHYKYTVSYYICKYQNKNNQEVEKLFLRKTNYSLDAGATNATWSAKEENESDTIFNFREYLIKENVSYACSVRPEWSIFLDSKEMYLKDEAIKIKILDKTKLSKIIKFLKNLDEPKESFLSYEGCGFIYFLFHSGYGCCSDIDSRLFIIAVNSKEIHKARNEITAKQNNSLGMNEYFKKNYTGARDYFLEALNIDSTYTLARLNLASTYVLLKQEKNAIEELKIAYKQNPKLTRKKMMSDKDYDMIRNTIEFKNILI